MSWLGSLSGSLRPDSGAVEEFSGVSFSGVSSEPTARSRDACEGEEEEPIEQGSPRRRAKEDLSEFTKALSNKLWGVASFLAPPTYSRTPSPSSSSSPRIYFSAESSPSLHSQQQEPTISGDSELVVSFESSRTARFRSDFADIGGTLKTGIARLSNNVAINGISKIASTFLPLREEEEEEEEEEEVEEKEEYEDEDVSHVIGVTDEVLAFARNIACHPETWLDFPLLSDDEEFDDFDMSVAQHDHALVLESLAPRLAALRIELCPTHMSIGCFWMIYFALLHPRLNKHDADLLSTPQIVEARAMLQHGLQSQQAKKESEYFWEHWSYKKAEDALNSPEQFSTPRMLASPTKPWLAEGNMCSSSIKDFDKEKHCTLTLDAEFVDKFVVNEEPYMQKKVNEIILDNLDDEEDDDEWPEDETQDVNNAGMAAILISNEEDISFSDLEDDDCFTKQAFIIGSKS